MLAMSNDFQIYVQNTCDPNPEIVLGFRSTFPDPANRKQRAFLSKLSNPLFKDQELARTSPESPQQCRVVSKEGMLSWYEGIFGNISFQTKSKVIEDALNVHFPDRRPVSEENILIFKPSFMKSQYEIRTVKRYGHISRTLSVDCVVGFEAPIFDMCSAGDIIGLRDAIYSGRISRDVVNPLGMGLLHVSTPSDLYTQYLTIDSMLQVAFREIYVLGFLKLV